jgi:ectoine hydroxylase-related dioxygenase (phytanoyl-CoA dioxygenase family)
VNLDAAQRRFFAEHGWVVVRKALPDDDVLALRAAVEAAVPRHWIASSRGRVLELAAASRASPAIAAFARDGRLSRLIAQALDAPRLQLLQDTLFIKAPNGGGRVEWHQDFTYLGYLDPPRAATLRLALSSETEETGCLRVLDGSHQWGHSAALQALTAQSVEDALGALPAELRQRAAAAEVLVPLEPGDATLHHCLTFHGSGENRGGQARTTLAVRAFDAACTALRERLPPHAVQHFPLDERGGLAASAFPLIYDAALEAG